MKIGFDAEKYLEEQSKYILERINGRQCERLYLEFGGKLVHDRHAMRVLPGFDQNAGNEEGHIGIENVRERLRMLCDGSLTIRSSVTVGTEVVIIIPNGQKNP